MSDATDIDTSSEIAAEARENFNLMDRLRGRPARTKEVTVYTDEVAGRKHAELAVLLEAAKGSEEFPTAPEDYAELQEAVRDAAREVLASALTFKMRAVPPIIIKVANKKTRKALGIKGTPSAEQVDDFTSKLTAYVLKDCIESYTDHQTGAVRTDITVEQVEALADFLPIGQFAKLDSAANELTLQAQIADRVTTDADF